MQIMFDCLICIAYWTAKHGKQTWEEKTYFFLLFRFFLLFLQHYYGRINEQVCLSVCPNMFLPLVSVQLEEYWIVDLWSLHLFNFFEYFARKKKCKNIDVSQAERATNDLEESDKTLLYFIWAMSYQNALLIRE